MNRSTRNRAAVAMLAAAAITLTACSSDTEDTAEPVAGAASTSVLEPGEANPMIAQGVTIAGGSAVYKTSGLGPSAMNKAAPEGSPESYIDTAQFSGGALPPGVSVTEAQGIGVLKKIRENLEAQGLTLGDVTTMRVFLDNAPGTDRADYAGWNRAYRQFFANTNLDTGDTELVAMGTGEPAAPLERNGARPTRFALEVGSLPVPGWLVEVEVDAVYPAGKGPQ
ncbi:Rid family hydrolase [Rhodococcus sp. NPDC058514]|uniref:Rid family hydrolase n=1 Tax=unclassified Rhodococcus (in: high G+C Gram-positive bacteria) TaxID=192944 RepID=UPI0036507535